MDVILDAKTLIEFQDTFIVSRPNIQFIVLTSTLEEAVKTVKNPVEFNAECDLAHAEGVIDIRRPVETSQLKLKEAEKNSLYGTRTKYDLTGVKELVREHRQILIFAAYAWLSRSETIYIASDDPALIEAARNWKLRTLPSAMLRNLLLDDETVENRAVQPSAKREGDPYRITGTTLGQRYLLLEYTGGGGMGAVYRSRDTMNDQIVAVKILKPDIAARDRQYFELFEKEVKAAQRLRHPNIVSIIDSGSDADLNFMVMEWIDGPSIEDVIAAEQLSLRRINWIFSQICDALTYAHERNVIHLDIKPANILMPQDEYQKDVVKVIDFGLSRIISRESGTTVTKFRGTHQYCAPEQFGGKVSHRSDIYSLGATLYHLVSGVIPFSTTYINAKMHPEMALPDLPSLTKYLEVPQAIDYVIAKALQKNPVLRQQSARELFEEFSKAISTAM